MNRGAKAILVAGSLAVATVVAMVVVLPAAFARIVDPHDQCRTGFSTLVGCTYHWSSTTTHQGTPVFTTPSSATSNDPPGSRDRPDYTETIAWAVAQCPQNDIARRLLCAATPGAALAQAASDDLATGLPRPKPWFVTTAKKTPLIESVHVETPLMLAVALGFYRAELGKRGWTENDGAVVEPDRAMIAFTTSEGPALLRLTRQDNRTIADLSLRKPAAANGLIPPRPAQVKLLLGNGTDEEAAITINGETIKLAPRVGSSLRVDPYIERKTQDNPEVDLSPGRFTVTLKIASGAAQSRTFEVAAGETWGLVAGPDGVPLPVQLY
jgi:hypothetical protein